MGPKLKIILCFLLVPLLMVTPIFGSEFTYKEYAKAPEDWRRGFVSGIAESMTIVPQPDEQPPYPVRAAFQRCLEHESDANLVRHVQTYVAANPGGSKGPITAVIMRAIFDLCRREIPRTLPAR